MSRSLLHVVRLLVIVTALVGSGPLTGRAQDSTPAAGLVPVPTECAVDRRSVAEIIAFLPETAATPDPARGGPIRHAEDATPTPLALPPGQPADTQTIVAITTTLGQLFACYNAGDRLRALSLVSDRSIAAAYSPGVLILELEEQLAEPATPVAVRDRIEAFAITDVVVLADGRVAALVGVGDPDEEPAIIYVVEQNGRWLIDEIPEQ